jgi:uncharacterized membrane protein
MERYVYVQEGNKFEKRNVKVGIADFFFAEIQEGLTAGTVVSLEIPKEEIEKKARELANNGPSGASGKVAGSRATNAPKAATTTPVAPAKDVIASTNKPAATSTMSGSAIPSTAGTTAGQSRSARLN